MSTVNALIIKNKKISFHSAHYNKIIKLLELQNPTKPIDAGYIIIDFDNNVIFNAQNAFSIKDLNNNQLKKMMLFTI